MSHSNFTSNDYMTQLNESGWASIPYSEARQAWRKEVLPVALESMRAPELQAWWRYQNTWFVGVNALPNDSQGRVASGTCIGADLRDLLASYVDTPAMLLDQAQISACLPGYPQIDPTESPAAFAFRQHSFAAHLDGLRPIGPQRRRHLKEQHSFILGIPLTEHSPEAGPVMVWPGSHTVIQRWLQEQFEQKPPSKWEDVDLTESYQSVRQQILSTITPIAVYVPPGGAYLIHRHALHGQGLWPKNLMDANQQGRVIAYFRPCLHEPFDWLNQD